MRRIAAADVAHGREDMVAAARQPFGRVPSESCACTGDEYDAHGASSPRKSIGSRRSVLPHEATRRAQSRICARRSRFRARSLRPSSSWGRR